MSLQTNSVNNISIKVHSQACGLVQVAILPVRMPPYVMSTVASQWGSIKISTAASAFIYACFLLFACCQAAYYKLYHCCSPGVNTRYFSADVLVPSIATCCPATSLNKVLVFSLPASPDLPDLGVACRAGQAGPTDFSNLASSIAMLSWLSTQQHKSAHGLHQARCTSSKTSQVLENGFLCTEQQFVHPYCHAFTCCRQAVCISPGDK